MQKLTRDSRSVKELTDLYAGGEIAKAGVCPL
jgi:hypothetical protein